MSTSELGYNSKVEGNVVLTTLDAAVNWMRKNSLWPMPMGLACCAIELMASASTRFDIARFGAEVMRFSPRQSDLMIVAGTVTYKMALARNGCGSTRPLTRAIYTLGPGPRAMLRARPRRRFKRSSSCPPSCAQALATWRTRALSRCFSGRETASTCPRAGGTASRARASVT